MVAVYAGLLLLAGCKQVDIPVEDLEPTVVYDWMAGESPIPNKRMGILRGGLNDEEHAVGPDGIYFIPPMTNESEDYVSVSDDSFILFAEHGSNALIKLCGRADCTHDNVQCDAYLYRGSELSYYGGYLYAVSGEGPHSQETKLVRMASNGRLHETVLDLLQFAKSHGGDFVYAKLLQSVSLFSQPGTFAYENTVKTARDFARMDGVEVTSGHDLAVTEFFADKWTDYSILILICVVCGLFVAERKEGLWPMVHAASGGRWRFALRRTLILLAAAWISTGILVGARVLLCGMEYHGLGEWGRTLQSIPMFHNVPIPMTIGQFWLFYITVKAMGAFMIGLVLWMMLSAISNIGLALCAAGLVLGVEFACMAIPSSSMFAPARYVNIFSYVDFTAVFTRYLNISVFGTLVAGSDLVLVILPFLCAMFIGWNLLIAQCKRPITRMNRLLKWLDWIAKKLSPYFARGGEICKLLIKRRGILLLILLVLVVQRFEAPPRAYVAWDPFIQFYQEKYAGPITMEKLALMEEDLATCMDMYNREGLQIVLDDAKSAPEGAWIVPFEPYDAIWSNNEENHHRNTALIAMLFLVLILAPIAAQERQNGMTVLLRSTSGGRK